MPQHDDGVGERWRLLDASITETAVPSKLSVSRGIFYCILLNFLIEMYDMIIIAPTIALFERSLCSSYYSAYDPGVIGPGGSIDERLCKVEMVQQDLASLRGWKAFFDALPIFLVAIPLGRTADKFGRKKVLASSLFGSVAGLLWTLVVCHFYSVFPIRLVWLSAIFYLFGGGLSTANAMVYSMAADCSTESNSRSQLFYYVYSTYLVCELLAPAIASATMETSLWIPFGLGIFFVGLCVPVLIVMPESHKHDDDLSAQNSQQRSTGVDATFRSAASVHWKQIFGSRREDQESLLSVLRRRNMLLAFMVLLVGTMRPATLSVLLQYATVRFDWKISKAAMLISEVAIVNIVLFLFILPQAIRWISSRWRIQPQTIDRSIVHVSLLVLTLGALLIGLAPSIGTLLPAVIVFAVGFGTRVSTLSLVTSWSNENMRARVYGVIQIVENIGKLCAEPLLLNVFAASLKFPKFWLGLPFFTAAGFYCLGAFSWGFVRLSEDQ